MMKRILITDDAAFMRMSLRKMIEKFGFEVVDEAVNGLDAIKKYQKWQPDLVTMDITMPEMNGIDAIREIKKLNPIAKILVISAMGNESFVKEALIAGASGFILKPFKEEDLLKNLMKF
jgi:two-component system, chemotaxis family, chemotaxis protein CheY